MTTTHPNVVDAISQAVSSGVYRYSDEVALHQGLEMALASHGIAFDREVKVVGGRIDFLSGRVGIEVKIKGSPAAVRAQLAGYAADPRIDHLMLLTTRRTHLQMPETLAGVPVRTVLLGGRL